MKAKLKNISSLTVALGAFLVIAIAAATGLSIYVLREKAIEDWKRQSESIALILAENTAQQMTTAYLTLDGIVERVRKEAPADDAALRRIFGTEAIFRMMSDKATTSPQIDVATIVASNRDVINFTRSWPAPKINLADRDYFKAHRDDPKLDVLISKPVRNKGNQKWTFYISRRINDAKGQFIGLVLLGISCRYYTDFYEKIISGRKAAITLLRDDFTILARFPVIDDILGKQNLTGTTYAIIHDQKKQNGVIVTNSSRKAAEKDKTLGLNRMSAVHKVLKYPLIVNYTIEEAIYLEGWHKNVRLLLAVAFGSAIAIILSFFLLVRALKRSEQDNAETLRLKLEAEESNLEKSSLLELLSQKQQALTESSDRLSAIVNNAPDAILITDEAGKIESSNLAAQTVFKQSAPYIINASLSNLVQMVGASATVPQLGNTEGVGLRPNGEQFPCEMSVGQFHIKDGMRQVFILRDITERKRMEQVKTEFISVVSHELRTPLTAIRGSLGLIHGGAVGEVPEVMTRLLSLANQNTDRLMRMVNDLLDLQKIGLGKMSFDFSENLLKPMLEEAVNTNQTFGTEFGVNIMLCENIPDLKIRIDEGRLQQILSNLISNACKFSPRGSTVTVGSKQLENNRVLIEVIDQGEGIPSEFRERIFQRFTQANSSDIRVKGGTGLGLAITRELVVQMDGEIYYESTMGKGTTFSVIFPVV